MILSEGVTKVGIGNNIVKLRNLLGMTQEEFAKFAGVSRGAVSQWEAGISEPKINNIRKMAENLDIALSDLIEADGMDYFYFDTVKHKLTRIEKRDNKLPKGFMPINPVPTVKIPVVGVVHAGQPIDYKEVDYILDVPKTIIHHEDGYYGCVVEGDCMDRVYPEGCLVVVDTHKEPRDGSIGAFEIDGYQVVMRRVHRGANTLILSPESFNPEHRDIVITESDDQVVKAIGTVVWFQAREELD